jgi:uncharacterized membrane protein YcaP (DUF421 family)
MLFASNLWSDMFYLGLPVLEKILRPIIVYVFLIIGIRMAGKRQLAQLNAFDLVVLLTLANTVQNAIIGEDNSVTGGLIGAATLLAMNYVVVRFLYGHQKLDHLLEGEPDVLISNGKILHDRLKRELITEAELGAAARRQGFSGLDEVSRAVLEPGGTVTFCGLRPLPEQSRHDELVQRLEAVLEEIRNQGRSLQAKPNAS